VFLPSLVAPVVLSPPASGAASHNGHPRFPVGHPWRGRPPRLAGALTPTFGDRRLGRTPPGRGRSPSPCGRPPPARGRAHPSSTVSLMPTFSPVAAPTVLDLLTLEKLEEDLYRGTTVFEEPFALYGGQVAAQALAAAGDTVDPERLPHSLHGYYLRSGDAARPTVFRVYRDRDGRSFSARRVVAIQNGKVIFNMSASFHVTEPGVDVQIHPMPD